MRILSLCSLNTKILKLSESLILIGSYWRNLSIFLRNLNMLQVKSLPIYQTLHSVLLSMKQIKQCCNEEVSQTFEMTNLKHNCFYLINEKFNPHLYHKVVVFLNPRQKSMKVMSEEDQTIVLEEDKETYNWNPWQWFEYFNRIWNCTKYTYSNGYSARVWWWMTLQSFLCASFFLASVLTWWKEDTILFPNLSKLAEQVFCIMPTSAPCERTFSLAGHVVCKRRASLKSTNLDAILLLNNSLKQ